MGVGNSKIFGREITEVMCPSLPTGIVFQDFLSRERLFQANLVLLRIVEKNSKQHKLFVSGQK